MKKKKFSIIVVGGGPGGYVAAIRAAHENQSVALIESDAVGGTCLHWGCIPTKALLAKAHLFHQMSHAESLGISVKGLSFDFEKMSQKKDEVVQEIYTNLSQLISSHKVTLFRGKGKISSPCEVKVLGECPESLQAEKAIILATGSRPKNIPSFPFDGKYIHSSNSILQLKKLPKSMVIIGGGVIGCEFASLYAQLGVKITIIEALPRIFPLECEEISHFFTESLRKQGVEVFTGKKVEKVVESKEKVTVYVEKSDDGVKEEIISEMVLVAIGRSFNTEDIGLEEVGVRKETEGAMRGTVHVNERMETNIPGIYAIGDITGKKMFAHVASHQGIIAAINATGKHAVMDYRAIPYVVFTWPEFACVGMSFEEAQEWAQNKKSRKEVQIVRKRLPMQALGKAHATGETEGFAQIIFDKSTGEIFGAQVIASEASNLIAEIALAIREELTIESIAETVHAHPTLSEAWMEVSLLASGVPIHLPRSS